MSQSQAGTHTLPDSSDEDPAQNTSNDTSGSVANTNSSASPPVRNDSTRPAVVGRSASRQKGRGRNFTQEELVNLFSIMEQVVPIGPDEWESVLADHSIVYPGRDVDSIRRKFHSLHRKKVPTGDPNMPIEVKMAKRVKYLIVDKAELCGGGEGYNMESNTFGRDDGSEEEDVISHSATGACSVNPMVPPVVIDSLNTNARIGSGNGSQTLSTVSTPSNGSLRSRSNQTPKKIDFMEMMLLQMQNEASERAHDRKERAEDRRQLTQLLTTMASGYFMMQSSKNKKRKRKKKKRRMNHTNEDDSINSSSSDSDSSGSE